MCILPNLCIRKSLVCEVYEPPNHLPFAVIKTKVKRQRNRKLFLKKSKRVYKSRGGEEDRRALRRLRFSLTDEASCCTLAPSRKSYLIMGRRQGSAYIPTFVMLFKKSKASGWGEGG